MDFDDQPAAPLPDLTSADRMTEHRAPGTQRGAYRWYVLGVLMAALALSLIDRQILTILAGPVKADLNLSDAELGLLYGTAFAVFYSLFGIPLGRLADAWVRTRLMALSLLGWSAMTIFSGLATNLMQLSIARMGVGVGEATANPVAYSLLSDYFPKEKRATAIAIYSSGVALGVGGSLWAGGAVVDLWTHWFGTGPTPFGLKGWQAAFIAVGLPGILLAGLVLSLREPERGATDGMPQSARTTAPWSAFWAEVFAILPPFTVLNLVRLKAPRAVWRTHILVVLGIAAVATAMAIFTNAIEPAAKRHVLFVIGNFEITGHTLQWTALSIGIYGVFAWAQSLRLRDAPAFALIWKSPPMVALLAAAALEMITNYGLTAFTPFYAVTTFHMPLARVGLEMGIVAGLAGLIGTNLGGIAADYFRGKNPSGRLYVSLFAMVAPVPLVPVMLAAPTLEILLAWWMLVGTIVTAWLAGIASSTQDLVLPRMRGTSAAALTLSMTMIGLGLGPYSAGLVADVTGSLYTGIVSVYAVVPLTALCMIIAIRTIGKTEATLLDRARAAGEPLSP